MSGTDDLIQAIASAADSWRDPAHEKRQRAVQDTLAAENVFTEEAVAFAVNQQMAQLTCEQMNAWLAGRAAARPLTVGVLNPGNLPFVELQDFLAVVLVRHRYLGALSSRSPALLRAFVGDVRSQYPALDAEFIDADSIFHSADAVIATGTDETARWVDVRCDAAGIPESRRLLRGHRFAVAVLDGRETADDFERLAEDVLLHEGLGCRNVAVIWAPAGMAPDPLLEAFAHFRAVFPAHAHTPGRLKMQKAFLEALEQPHAYGEGLEFLLSKGTPEEQQPGHVRWSEYERIDDVRSWLTAHAGDLQLVVARAELATQLNGALELAHPGDAQRPPLSWRPDGIDTIDFLIRLD